MAQLNDTMVQGDLRVTGTLFGTQAGNYATCATAAGTAAKEVTISGFTLTTGIHVFVKFTVTNTATVATLTMNVSGTGAKAMKYRGGNLPAVGTLSASRVYEFIYDGTNWELVGDLDTNTQSVSGVKGNAESSYRTGQVNLTAANIGASASDHAHGNITNGGALQTNDITIASGDKLVVTDSSDSNKIARASISFDGSTTSKALTQKGTFESFAKAGDITTAIQALDVSSVGGDGKYIKAISETDGKISATAETMDTSPTANSIKAITSGGVFDGLSSKQSDIKYQLVEYGAVDYAAVTTIISSGKTPVVREGSAQSGYTIYIWDGSVWEVDGVNEYRFVRPSANVDSPRLFYVSLRNNSSGWRNTGVIGITSLATYNDLEGRVSALESLAPANDTLFHTETLNVTDQITRFLKITFSGRVGRCIAVISIAGGSSTTNAVFRLSWTLLTTSEGITDVGKEMISCSNLSKPPLVYRDSSNFYIGIYDSLNRSATVSVMMSSENSSYVSYSTVARATATSSDKTAIPITWHPVMSETIDEIYAAVYDDTSGTTVATTFNELKSWYSTRPNIILVVRHTTSGTTTQDIYRLVDTEYANGSATKFVFSRTMNDAGFVGQVETMTCTSSGWAYSRPLSSTSIADNNDNLITTAGVKAAFDYWMPLKQNALNFTDTPSSINPVATKTYVDTYYNNNAAFGRWAYCYYGNAMYLFDGLRHHIMTFDDGNIASWVKRATENFAQSVEIIIPVDSGVTMLNLHQTYSSDGAYHAFAPGGRYVFTVQNMSNNTIAVKLFVGGCFPSVHLYDCWSVVHDGEDDTYIGWLDYDNPIGWHEHLLANVGIRSSKSWEIIVPPEYVVPSGQGYNYKSIQYVIISTIK